MSPEANIHRQTKEELFMEAEADFHRAIRGISRDHSEFLSAHNDYSEALRQIFTGSRLIVNGFVDKELRYSFNAGWLAEQPSISTRKLDDQEILISNVYLKAKSENRDDSPYLEGNLVDGSGDGKSIRFWLNECRWTFKPDHVDEE